MVVLWNTRFNKDITSNKQYAKHGSACKHYLEVCTLYNKKVDILSEQNLSWVFTGIKVSALFILNSIKCAQYFLEAYYVQYSDLLR